MPRAKSQYRYQQKGLSINWALVAFVVLIALVALTHYALWFGDRSIPSLRALKERSAEAQLQNTAAAERNTRLKSDIIDLQTGTDAIEERARNEMGLIKEGETFIYFDDESSE